MVAVNIPTISHEVADAIERLRTVEPKWDNETILYNVVNPTNAGGSTATLRSVEFDVLLAALVNGYHREPTEEEKHAELDKTYRDHAEGNGFFGTEDEDLAYAKGIKYALNTLGITVEGVNA